MDYGKKLKELREYNNFSQYDIAKLLNITRSSYNYFEHQYGIIPLNRLNELANIFDTSIDYILDLTKVKKYNNSKKEINISISSERLKSFRKEQNLTQAKLANILNSVHSVVGTFERGENLIATPFLYTICKKFNISADYLLGKTDSPKYLK